MSYPAVFSGPNTDWVLLTDHYIGQNSPVRIDMVLLHPMLGVALIEIAPRWTENAATLFLMELDKARFTASFRGAPPVVHLMVAREELTDLPQRIIQGFREQPPLQLVGDASWVQTARRLVPPQPTPALPPSLPPPAPVAPLRGAGKASWWREGLALTAVLLGLGGLGLVVHERDAVLPPARPPAPMPLPSLPPVAERPASVPEPVQPEPPEPVAPPPPAPQAPPEAPPPPAPQPAPPLPLPPQIPPPPPPQTHVPAQPARLANKATIDRLMIRGNALYALGDFSSARKFFERAAEHGSVEGAIAAGRTHEPNGHEADIWYRLAEELKSAATASRSRPPQ